MNDVSALRFYMQKVLCDAQLKSFSRMLWKSFIWDILRIDTGIEFHKMVYL